jgi:hypothetical protein
MFGRVSVTTHRGARDDTQAKGVITQSKDLLYRIDDPLYLASELEGGGRDERSINETRTPGPGPNPSAVASACS